MGPDFATYGQPRSRLEETCRMLIDVLHPGFAARPRSDTRMKVLLLANQAARLTTDDYARRKALDAIRWASIAFSAEEGRGWDRGDAEAFALEDAYRLWRQVRGG